MIKETYMQPGTYVEVARGKIKNRKSLERLIRDTLRECGYPCLTCNEGCSEPDLCVTLAEAGCSAGGGGPVTTTNVISYNGATNTLTSTVNGVAASVPITFTSGQITTAGPITIGATTFPTGSTVQSILVALAALAHVPVTVVDSATIDFTASGVDNQTITADLVGASTATAGQVPQSDGAGGITWGTISGGAGHVPATVVDSPSINFTASGVDNQTLTGIISGSDTATNGQVLQSDGAGGLTWATLAAGHPAATVDPTSNPALSINVATQVLDLDLDTPNSYDNTTSGLTSNSIQGAIDELASTTYTNGLTKTGSDVEWGGTLEHDTSISGVAGTYGTSFDDVRYFRFLTGTPATAARTEFLSSNTLSTPVRLFHRDQTTTQYAVLALDIDGNQTAVYNVNGADRAGLSVTSAISAEITSESGANKKAVRVNQTDIYMEGLNPRVAETNIVYYDPVTDRVSYGSFSPGGLASAVNGLNVSGSDVLLGGPLTQDTTVNGVSGTYQLTFDGLKAYYVLTQDGDYATYQNNDITGYTTGHVYNPTLDRAYSIQTAVGTGVVSNDVGINYFDGVNLLSRSIVFNQDGVFLNGVDPLQQPEVLMYDVSTQEVTRYPFASLLTPANNPVTQSTTDAVDEFTFTTFAGGQGTASSTSQVLKEKIIVADLLTGASQNFVLSTEFPGYKTFPNNNPVYMVWEGLGTRVGRDVSDNGAISYAPSSVVGAPLRVILTLDGAGVYNMFVQNNSSDRVHVMLHVKYLIN